MSNELSLSEKSLELVVSEKTLGTLVTNAKQICEIIKATIPNYSVDNYNSDNIDEAKKDKAMLNSTGKALNDKRIEYEKEFMKPFAEFKDTVAETCTLIKTASANIDTIVKQAEIKEKELKKEKITELWAQLNFSIVPLEKVFVQSWLNKSAKLKDVAKEMDTIIAKIKDDISAIEAIGDDVEMLKAMYLDNLDLSKTIQYANTLKQNRIKLQEQEKAKQAYKQSQQETHTMPYSSPIMQPQKPVSDIVEVIENAIPLDISLPQLLVRAFKVTTTKENIIALGNFMNENNIKFEKVEG